MGGLTQNTTGKETHVWGLLWMPYCISAQTKHMQPAQSENEKVALAMQVCFLFSPVLPVASIVGKDAWLPIVATGSTGQDHHFGGSGF